MTDALERLRALARDRKRRQRDRERLRLTEGDAVTASPSPCDRSVTVTESVTPGVTSGPALHERAPTARWASWALTVVALAMFGSAICANAEYAWTLGASPISSAVFCAIGVATDCLVFLLPLAASRSPLPIALVGWTLWVLALAFAVCGAVGFAALNITDTVAQRSERSSPAIELAKMKLAAASAAVAAECRRVGPLCRARQGDERQAIADLGGALAAQAAVADPQVSQAVKLVAWLTSLRPAEGDLAMVRLGLIVLIPQLAGLVLLVARR
jgi:hypothetical protein